MSVSQYKKYIWLVDTIRANRRINKEQIGRKTVPIIAIMDR